MLKLRQFAKNTDRTLDFFHWGDLDAGGIEIFLNLRQATGIYVHPFLYSSEIIEYYKDSCKQLERSDKKRLLRMREQLNNLNIKERTTLGSLIDKMLEMNRKLEQEAVDIHQWIHLEISPAELGTKNI